MFGGKKQKTQIDKEQLELIENAQHRIKQKKRLYIHFVFFLIGTIFLILANTVLEIGRAIRYFGFDWFVFVVFGWLFLLVYHTFNVYVTSKFMGKAWEKKQLEKLVQRQQNKINKLKEELEKQNKLVVQKAANKQHEKRQLCMIVAVSENDVIGKNNTLIWHLKDDLKRFKELTNGHCIIMGRKTFESFPKPLPNRTHIVITRQSNYEVPNGVIVVNTLEDALDAAKKDMRPYIIGGGDIYKQAINFVDVIEITRIHQIFDGDTFFPKIDPLIWEETQNIFHAKDESHDYPFSFLTYVKKPL